jgi:hypothetical protein
VLTAYITNTQNLLQKPAATTPLYPASDITNWINIARGQLAGEAECIRVQGTISTVVGQRNYAFSALNLGTPTVTGVEGIIHMRSIQYGIGGGTQWIPSRAWEWFNLYALSNPVPPSGFPMAWAQYGQGSSGQGTGSGASGSFYIDPVPDAVYPLTCDCVCYPITLALDSDVEAIPYLWTDAVPFFAAYYALLSAQSSARVADAERMFKNYQTFSDRARKFANPSVERWQYEQAGDVAQAAAFGIKPNAGAGAQ